MKLIPKKHQIDAIDNVFTNQFDLDTNERTQIIMACGTGNIYFYEKGSV